MSEDELRSLEKRAMNGEEMPVGLNGSQQILFQSLRLLYRNLRAGTTSRPVAIAEKRQLLKAYGDNRFREGVWEDTVKMWGRVELAVAAYNQSPTLEAADTLVKAIYGAERKKEVKT